MSSPFGVPPPPPPQVVEPGWAQALQADEAAYSGRRRPEPDRGRRRATVALAFVAVALLVLGNLAAWLHFTVLSPRFAADVVAARTVGEAGPIAATSLDPAVATWVRTTAQNTHDDAAITAANAPDTVAKSDAAVQLALTSPAFRADWSRALANTAVRQRALAHGARRTLSDTQATVYVSTDPLSGAIADDLATSGYPFMRGAVAVLPPLKVATVDDAADYAFAIGPADSYWWLLLVGAVAFGAASVALATRRLRLGITLAVDALVMLAGCLLLVPLIGATVTGQAVDPTQTRLLRSAYTAVAHRLVVQTVALMVVAACVLVVLKVLERTRGRRGRAQVDALVDA